MSVEALRDGNGHLVGDDRPDFIVCCRVVEVVTEDQRCADDAPRPKVRARFVECWHVANFEHVGVSARAKRKEKAVTVVVKRWLSEVVEKAKRRYLRK